MNDDWGSDPQVQRRVKQRGRRQQIIDTAITLFARDGFTVSTSELTLQMGVTRPLLYQYFPTKEALIDVVCAEVLRWDAQLGDGLRDRHRPLQARLKTYFVRVAKQALDEQWIRLLTHAGMARPGANAWYFERLRAEHFTAIAEEIRHTYALPAPENARELEEELNLISCLHSSVMAIGIQAHIHHLPRPSDVDHAVSLLVRSFLHGATVAITEDRVEIR